MEMETNRLALDSLPSLAERYTGSSDGDSTRSRRTQTSSQSLTFSNKSSRRPSNLSQSIESPTHAQTSQNSRKPRRPNPLLHIAPKTPRPVSSYRPTTREANEAWDGRWYGESNNVGPELGVPPKAAEILGLVEKKYSPPGQRQRRRRSSSGSGRNAGRYIVAKRKQGKNIVAKCWVM
jgi:hypothetical protein